MFDLDGLLRAPRLGTGDKDEEIRKFWQDEDEDFCDECYLVQAIEHHLLTEEQSKLMYENKLTIEKMLNGRYGGDLEPVVSGICQEWNKKLGFDSFGF